MSERHNANLFEVLIGQVAQNSEVNIVLGKRLNVLGHTELLEPIRNLLHRSAPEYLSLASASAGWCVYPAQETIVADFRLALDLVVGRVGSLLGFTVAVDYFPDWSH